jgi:hypothetical protein
MRHVNRDWLRLLLVAFVVLLIGGGASVSLAADAPGTRVELGPAASPDQSAFKPLAVGGQHACALAGDGTVMCWGLNFFGNLGDGTTVDATSPVTVVADAGGSTPLSGAVAIAAGFTHTCAVVSDSTVRCWGDNASNANVSRGGQLGDGTTVSSLTPVTVTDADGAGPLSGVAAISAGWFRTCALLEDGTVTCWGDGQLTPAAVTTDGGDLLSDVTAIASAFGHTCALRADTTVACWGSNRSGELGDGTTSDSLTAVEVAADDSGAALTDVVAIAVGGGFSQGFGGGFTCALLVDGTVRCWGNNDFGQVGDGRPIESFAGMPPVTTPTAVVAAAGSPNPLSGATAITAGCALLADTTVTCWLGPERQSTVIDPVSGNSLSDVEVVASGGFGFCAVIVDGTILCPGSDPPSPGLVILLPTPEPIATAEPAPAVTAEAAPEPTGDSVPAATPGPRVIDDQVREPAGQQPATPVAFRDSVPSPAQITLDPVIVAQSLFIAAAIVLFVPFPGVLFNSTLEANYPEVVGRVRGARRRLRALFALIPIRARRAPTAPVDSDPPLDVEGGPGTVTTGPTAENRPAPEFWTTLRGITLFLLLTALLGSFLDPTFGPDPQSLATFVGLAAGLVVTLAAFGLPVAFAFRRSAIPFLVQALPGTLLVGVACVLISRLTDFQPGYLYGLVIGVGARELSVVAPPRTVAVAIATTLVVAVIAWFALLFVAPLAAVSDPGLWIVALQTALVTVLVAGLEGVFFGMLPVRFLPGEAVFRWNRRVWAALFGIATVGFLLIVMNPTSGYLADGTRTPMFTILALLVFFGLGSVAFWAYFRFRRPPVVASAAP